MKWIASICRLQSKALNHPLKLFAIALNCVTNHQSLKVDPFTLKVSLWTLNASCGWFKHFISFAYFNLTPKVFCCLWTTSDHSAIAATCAAQLLLVPFLISYEILSERKTCRKWVKRDLREERAQLFAIAWSSRMFHVDRIGLVTFVFTFNFVTI